ncbi:hypothetical protein CXG81DRAFT_15745, partial [Caulochytrium protostelioides]
MLGFNANKTKVQLKLAVGRLKLMQQKKGAANAAAKREIASLLEAGKEESARVRVEHVIREDFTIEAYEMLELYSELLLTRWGLVETVRHCDDGIAESVHTLMYAAPRCDIKELAQVREGLVAKYGKDLAQAAMANATGLVNPRLVHKLGVQTPDPVLVVQYLVEIAKTYHVDWD